MGLRRGTFASIAGPARLHAGDRPSPRCEKILDDLADWTGRAGDRVRILPLDASEMLTSGLDGFPFWLSERTGCPSTFPLRAQAQKSMHLGFQIVPIESQS